MARAIRCRFRIPRTMSTTASQRLPAVSPHQVEQGASASDWNQERKWWVAAARTCVGSVNADLPTGCCNTGDHLVALSDHGSRATELAPVAGGVILPTPLTACAVRARHAPWTTRLGLVLGFGGRQPCVSQCNRWLPLQALQSFGRAQHSAPTA